MVTRMGAGAGDGEWGEYWHSETNDSRHLDPKM